MSGSSSRVSASRASSTGACPACLRTNRKHRTRRKRHRRTSSSSDCKREGESPEGAMESFKIFDRPREKSAEGPKKQKKPEGTRAGRPRRRQLKLAIILLLPNLLFMFLARPASAENGFAAQTANELPSPEPLVLLLNELGSGEGPHHGGGAHSRGPLPTPSEISPALIEARCWNNYENDDDCKHLNVITAPAGERRPGSEPSREANQQQQYEGALITPVVIFEASSTIEPAQSGADDDQQPGGRPIFMAPPYYSSQPPDGADQSTQPAGTTTTPGPSQAPTRPSVVHFVATPQPTRGKRPKTTTAGRKCRDELDADCDEPEESQTGGKSSSTGGRRPENQDDDDDGDENDGDEEDNEGQPEDERETANEIGGPASQSNLIEELGSGSGMPGRGGAADDDTDDSTDDADGEGPGEASGNEIGDPPGPSTPRLLEVTSVYPLASPPPPVGSGSEESTRPTDQGTGATSSSAPPPRRPQTGAAEIEVVVHSTLPPSFPVSGQRKDSPAQTIGEDELDQNYVNSIAQLPQETSTRATTTTSTTTQMPDDTFTSKPIFPPTTSGGSPDGATDESGNSPQQQQQQVSTPSTTEPDLYTFRPIPMPAPESVRPPRLETTTTSGGDPAGSPDKSAGGTRQEQQSGVNAKNLHEPARKSFYGLDRPPSEGWTTRRPMGGAQNQAREPPPPGAFLQIGPPINPAKSHHHSLNASERLATLMMYAGIVIVAVIAIGVLVTGIFYWRQNTLRRRTLLAKAHMLNGAARPPPMMIESMSTASHLMHGGGPGGGAAPGGVVMAGQTGPYQQGLLSTYAPGKGLSMGKVTTSLVKQEDSNPMLGGEDEDEEEEEEEEDRPEVEGEQRQRASGHAAVTSRQAQQLDEDSSIVDLDQQQQQQQQRQRTGNTRTRNPRLAHNSNAPNQSNSWSTEDPTTTTTTSSGGSQKTQDSQQLGGQHQVAGQAGHSSQRYPNSLSDGRQNSESLSDSQCSPDQGPSQAGMMQQPPNSLMSGSMNGQQRGPPMPNGSMTTTMMMPSSAHHNQPMRPFYPTNGHQQLMGGAGRPLAPPGGQHLIRQPFHPMTMVQNGHQIRGLGLNKQQRLVTSRSIEDIQQVNSHVGFVNEQQSNLHQVPYQTQQGPVLLHLVQARPQYQIQQQQVAGSQPMSLQGANNQQQMIISPQRIAMNPLATMGRRFPPGTGLNRNIYSEDSSSLMTTSPSLARTSSSSLINDHISSNNRNLMGPMRFPYGGHLEHQRQLGATTAQSIGQQASSDSDRLFRNFSVDPEIATLEREAMNKDRHKLPSMDISSEISFNGGSVIDSNNHHLDPSLFGGGGDADAPPESSTMPRRTMPPSQDISDDALSSLSSSTMRPMTANHIRLAETSEQASYFSSSIGAINRELKELRHQRMALGDIDPSMRETLVAQNSKPLNG